VLFVYLAVYSKGQSLLDDEAEKYRPTYFFNSTIKDGKEVPNRNMFCRNHTSSQPGVPPSWNPTLEAIQKWEV
jgi:hypothetical protein